MDPAQLDPLPLAHRLRRSRVDERLAALLATAAPQEPGVSFPRKHDAAAARHLVEVLETPVRQAAAEAANRFTPASCKRRR